MRGVEQGPRRPPGARARSPGGDAGGGPRGLKAEGAQATQRQRPIATVKVKLGGGLRREPACGPPGGVGQSGRERGGAGGAPCL